GDSPASTPEEQPLAKGLFPPWVVVGRMGIVRGNPEGPVMPEGRFAELNRGNRPAGVPPESANPPGAVDGDRRNTMRRSLSSAQRTGGRRTGPFLESLESRRLLSLTSLHQGNAPAVISPGGAFSHHDREFRYITPIGGHATIRVVGLGNLSGTTLDSSGDLHLVYGGTNAFSKIVGSVQGGGGHAPLASILNSQLINAGAANSLSGIGGNVLESVLMSDFDLIAGGTITLTAGVNSVNLNSIGANTQVNLRALPPAPTPTPTPAATFVGLVSTPTPTGNTVSLQAAFGPSTSSSSSRNTTIHDSQSSAGAPPYRSLVTYQHDTT